MNLVELFHKTAVRQPGHPAIVDMAQRRTVTYRELRQAISDVGDRLARAGVGPGTCVGIHGPSGFEYIVATYAVWRCDACAVPIPIELTDPEKREILQNIAIDFVIAWRSRKPISWCHPTGRPESLPRDLSLVRVASERQPPGGLAPLHPAFIRFTSGTTGAAKGVVLSHATIRERIEAANEALAINPADRVLWLLSMSYHFAVSIVGYLSFGATIVLSAGSLAGPVVQAVDGHGATAIYGSPMHYGLLADYAGRASLSTVRLAISTTTALDRLTAERFHHRYDRPVTQALGIIELGLPCINTRFATDRPEAVGCVLPAYELRLSDVGLGPRRQEILLRGKGLLDAYYQPWQTRDQILSGGWFRTGDVGYLDGDGCLFIRGRTKEVLSVMGIKFFPQEVEGLLASHPLVAAAYVSAEQHSRFGTLTIAHVVPVPGASRQLTGDSLRAFCRTRLTTAKIPHRFVLVEDLPRTASGKLRRLPAEAIV